MRYVPYKPHELILSSKWLVKLKKLESKIFSETDPDKRLKIINTNQAFWRYVKTQLKQISSKCWYSEADPLSHGSDIMVDHFRPKAKVAECKMHPGYWWLAFKLENYRLSCCFSNSLRGDTSGLVGGKSYHFPLVDESKRALTPQYNYSEEQPFLLDPCNEEDVKLLTFREDGEAMPRFNPDSDHLKNKRAEISIKCYNLNNINFIRARLKLRETLDLYLLTLHDHYENLLYLEKDNDRERSYKLICTTISILLKMCDRNAAYSSFCIAYLQAKNSDFYKTYLAS